MYTKSSTKHPNPVNEPGPKTVSISYPNTFRGIKKNDIVLVATDAFEFKTGRKRAQFLRHQGSGNT